MKTHKGEKVAFVYIRKDADIPKEQEPLKIWENNSEYKIQKFNHFLARLN